MEKQGHPLAHLLPREPPRIYVTEVNDYNLVGKQKQHHGLSEFLQLVRARLDSFAGNSVVQSHTDGQILPFRKVPPYLSLSLDLIHFQEDIVNSYFSGKPIIQDISSIRTVFKFKEAKKDSGIRDLHADLLVATSDITVLSDDLPEEYQVPLEAHHSHQLEYEFHSTNYHTLKVIVIGLQTAVQHLVKALKKEEEVSS